ncbi:hypothetical protein AYO38_06390 [bacterium SCGC AG-212-C10]|nr:hypothetical protein AYO38_06390 [bacterium SCGC AG-212-C10]
MKGCLGGIIGLIVFIVILAGAGAAWAAFDKGPGGSIGEHLVKRTYTSAPPNTGGSGSDGGGIDVEPPEPSVNSPESGWEITSFSIDYDIAEDGVVMATEVITVDFHGLLKHGIYRDLITKLTCEPSATSSEALFACPAGKKREYLIDQVKVTDGNGDKVGLQKSRLGDYLHLRLGDADKFVSGVQEYRISYRIRGALNPFENHDEFYWNATGLGWVVPIESAAITVHVPDSVAAVDVLCFQGPSGSTDACPVSSEGNSISFASSGPLARYEGVTIFASFPKGAFTVAAPYLDDPVTAGDFFTLNPIEYGATAIIGLVGVAGVIGLWWNHGRDRKYKSLYYLTNDPTEGTKPLFGKDDIVVEFLPPEDLRPAQMGVILEESASTLDVSSTVVDLAVRGYLTITEIPKKGRFGSKDWVLTRKKSADSELHEYEKTLFNSLFEYGSKDDVRISELKNKFASKLSKVQEELMSDALQRKWFRGKPSTVRGTWVALGIFVVLAGCGLAFALGYYFAQALIAIPIVLAGLLLILFANDMPSRTAAGSESLRRVLGFKLYVSTAETRRQEFNEDQNILNKFAAYLPYAMVFGCVDKWSKAFEGLAGAEAATAGWYYGGSMAGFHATQFSNDMQGFASSVGSTFSSTPGGSGGSGGGGGSSGGGGGGGGGGSW